MSNKKIIAIVGPTGSGKTDAAIELAKKFNGVIISADSRQVYESIDIGTNKVGQPSEWLGEKSYLIDGIHQLMINCVLPGQTFTLNDWLSEAVRLVSKIIGEGKLPIICGGTGLYVTALLEGYIPGGGRGARVRQSTNYHSLVLQLEKNREELYQKSDIRIAEIFPSLLLEVKQLLKSGISEDWLIGLGLDYRYATLCLQGDLNQELAIKNLQQASRHYIRRQVTWWRHHLEVETVTDLDMLIKKTEAFLKEEEK